GSGRSPTGFALWVAAKQFSQGPFMKHRILIALLAVVLPLTLARGPAAAMPAAEGPAWADTVSIAGYDPHKREWGVAVASKYLAVGSAVPWAKAGVGAVATQSLVNITYGPSGLELLAKGKSAEDVLKELTEADKGKESRQLGIVDA